MNHYYATGAPIFEGPPSKKRNAPGYGTCGHLDNYIHINGIKSEWDLNENRLHYDMTLIAPNGDVFIMDAKALNDEVRKKIYDWIDDHKVKKKKEVK